MSKSLLGSVLAIAALASIIACANGTVPDNGGATTDTTTTDAEDDASAPEPPTKYPSYDSGTKGDAAPVTHDSGATPTDSGTATPPTPQDSGAPPIDAAPPPPQDSGAAQNAVCDLSNPFLLVIYTAEYSNASGPGCPCAGSECCMLDRCIPK